MKLLRARVALSLVAAGGVLAGALSLAAPPEASGSPGSYLQALNRRGMAITDAALMLSQGNAVCVALGSVSGDIVYGNLIGPKFGYTPAEAQAILLSAVEEICPWHDHRRKWMV